MLLSEKRRAYFYKSIAIEMGGASRLSRRDAFQEYQGQGSIGLPRKMSRRAHWASSPGTPLSSPSRGCLLALLSHIAEPAHCGTLLSSSSHGHLSALRWQTPKPAHSWIRLPSPSHSHLSTLFCGKFQSPASPYLLNLGGHIFTPKDSRGKLSKTLQNKGF